MDHEEEVTGNCLYFSDWIYKYPKIPIKGRTSNNFRAAQKVPSNRENLKNKNTFTQQLSKLTYAYSYVYVFSIFAILRPLPGP